MQRLIVTSATYRQSSHVTPSCSRRTRRTACWRAVRASACPPRWCATMRWPPAACSIATIGGPSVFPYQPPGLWEELSRGETFTAQEYHESQGADLYRRSMYTFWKRTVPPAALTTFDAPDREKCTSRRLITNTPLQALVLLNDPTYVEAARVLAQRAHARSAARSAGARPLSLPRGHRAARRRRPKLRVLLELAQRRLEHYKKQPAAGREADRDRRVEGRQRGSRGTGGMDHGGQHHPQPRRDHYQGISHGYHHGATSSRARSTGIGIAALGSLLAQDGFAADRAPTGGLPGLPHFAPKAKRVVFLHQSGGPSQMDLFDYKPTLDKLSRHRTARQRAHGPAHHRHDVGADHASRWRARSSSSSSTGKSGAWVSELLPHTAKIVDDITIIKTMNTDAINHDPAITFIQSGSQQPGRPSMGAWVSYGLGSENRNLPAFVVMLSQAQALNTDQPLFSRLWGSGFLPSNHQGVRFRAGSNPVLYLHNPDGHRPGHAPRHARRGRQAQSHAPGSVRRSRRSRRASRSTRWRSACRLRCPI